MATLANWNEPEESKAGQSNALQTWKERTELYKLRPIPNEDVYFYSKNIDNSRLVREEDPEAAKRAWKMIGGATALSILAILLSLPSLMNVMAGMQIHALQNEQKALLGRHDAIELEEAKFMNPSRMKQYAKEQGLVDPAPGQVIYLNPQEDRALEAKLKK
jgi:hypothetical protein